MPRIRIYFTTIIVALVLSTIIGFLSNVFAALIDAEPQAFAMTSLFIGIIDVIVSLPVYFSSFYLIGKK